jgi:ATP-dependent helicase/DNAse subunit B
MTITLFRAAAGAGKTEAALREIAAVRQQTADKLPKIWILLATKQQQMSFRDRLLREHGSSEVFFNLDFFNFYELNAHLLMIARLPVRRISEAARLALLRTVAQRLQADGRLKFFAAVAQMPGFVSGLAQLIYELKRNLVRPDEFTKAASSPRERDLALIYEEYQALMQANELTDLEGEAWLALVAAEQRLAPVVPVDLLVVDGYDQFNTVQARILAALAASARRTFVTLSYTGDVLAGIGKRFDDAASILKAEAARAGLVLQETWAAKDADARPTSLQWLAEHLGADAPPVPLSDHAVQWLEAPDEEQETALVLRRVKRLLLKGVPPGEVLIAVRDWERYGPPLSAYTDLYQLPVRVGHSPALHTVPVAAMLLRVLRLHQQGFLRRDLLDILRSPLLRIPGISAEAVSLLEFCTQQPLVIQGRDKWLEALSLPVVWPDDDESPELRLTETAAFASALNAFFDAVTPPPTAGVASYVRWVDHLIGQDPLIPHEDVTLPDAGYTLGMIAALRESDAAAASIESDLNAIDQVRRVLRSILQVESLMSGLGQAQPAVKFSDFLEQFEAALMSARQSLTPPQRDGSVLVTSTADARGLPHQHVFIMGLSEGIFPMPAPQSPFLLDSETEALNARLGREAFLPQTMRANDSDIFYELLSQASASLTFSRPTIRDGKPWDSSYLWYLTQRVFSNADAATLRLRVGAPPDESESATPEELLMAVMHRWKQSNTAPENWHLPSDYPVSSDAWLAARNAHAAEWRRYAPTPPDAYSGQLAAPDNIGIVRRMLTEQPLSATQLNELAVCRYRWFARRGLGIQEPSPEYALDSRLLGTIYHKLMETLYGSFIQDGLTIAPENAAVALNRLEDFLHHDLPKMPTTYHFSEGGWWPLYMTQIARNCRALVQSDFEATPFAPGRHRRTVAVEQAFHNVQLTLADLQVQVRGSIDRIDEVTLEDDSRGYYVLDYKTSGESAASGAKVDTNYQALVYAAALNDLIAQRRLPPGRLMDVVFVGIGDQKSRSVKGSQDLDQALELSSQSLSQRLRLALKGDFGASPALLEEGKCSSYCAYYALCRIAVVEHKYQGED